MDKTKAKQTEIVLAKPEEGQALDKPCQLHWKDVRYTIAAFNRKIGNPMGGERYETDHIFGRCLGERSDGRTFFSTTILPWIWEPEYEWKMIARARLDSFLNPECKCDSRTEETMVCEFHLEAIAQWEGTDRRAMGLEAARKMPKATEGGGTFPLSKEMHPDYPWCREQEGRYICTICGYGKDPRIALGNPTYRNIFIRDHSHCGFGDASQYAPKNPNVAVSDNVIDMEKIAKSLDWAKESPLIIKKIDHPVFHRAEAVCLNCKRGVFRGEDKILYHLDLFRACHWSGLTVAEA